MLPDRAGPYAIGRPLGQGGVASVFASSDDAGKPVAIKLLGAEVLNDATRLARFRHEVDALARLRHANVLPLLDAGVDPDCGPYLVTPLLEGLTARERLAAVPAPCLAALVGGQLARGLVAVHTADLTHRDVKPENVMITANGEVVLIDFGLAIHPEHSRHTREGAIAGSVPYMSPEQIAGEPVTAASDVWALGVLLFEWASGSRPFARGRQQEEVAAILSGRVPSLGGFDRKISRTLEDLVTACLMLAPASRPTARAIVAVLDRELAWLEESAREQALFQVANTPAEFVVQAAPAIADWIASRVSSVALDPFEAMREIDRGLAYQPNHMELKTLANRAIAPPSGALAAARGTSGVEASIAVGTATQLEPVKGALSSQPSRFEHQVHPASPIGTNRRGLWLILALVGTAALAGTFGFLMATQERDPDADRGFVLNPSDPGSVVQAIFEAAKNDDTSALPGLCDPRGENDGDTRKICQAQVGSRDWPQFKSVFAGSSIIGSPRIGGRGAEVDFIFDGGRKETMKLVRRGTSFYLSSF